MGNTERLQRDRKAELLRGCNGGIGIVGADACGKGKPALAQKRFGGGFVGLRLPLSWGVG